jgi:hypothetical protein
MFGTQYNYLSNYVISSGFYREYLMSELAQFKSLLEKETIYYDPYSFLNRYSVVDLNSYIYAVNYKDNWVPRPFTTIPEKIKYFNFSDPQGRLDLSISFMTDPNNITYELLKNYKIDYFILDKQKDKKIINFLKWNTRKVFETRSYVCFEYK